MGIIVDVILLSTILGNTFIGFKKGLVKVAFGLVAFIVALAVALVLYKPVTQAIVKNTTIDDKIERTIIDAGSKKVENASQEELKSIDSYLEKYVGEAVTATQNDIVEQAAPIVTEKLVSTFVFVALMIITRLLLSLVSFLADTLAELPIIKQFNDLGGAIYGLILGLVIVYIALAIVFFMMSMSNNMAITNLIESTYITKIFYTHNLLLTVLF